MVAYFKDASLAKISPDDVRALIASLPFAQVTKRNHFKRLNALYNWAKLVQLVTVNPCEAVEAPQRASEDVTVLPVKDAFALFKTAWTLRPEVCARLALEAFAGVRFGTASQLVKEDVNFSDLGVNLPAEKGKKTGKVRRRHYIEHLPENLWPWLKAAPPESWTLTRRQYLSLKSDVFRLARVNNPGNVLRHSFCSYHVSLNADAAKTAVILTHTNQVMLKEHYRGRATSADGKIYFAITPNAIALSWEKFSKKASGR